MFAAASLCCVTVAVSESVLAVSECESGVSSAGCFFGYPPKREVVADRGFKGSGLSLWVGRICG